MMGARPLFSVRISQWPALLLAALLPACGGGGGGGGSGGTIKGVVADGPISGAMINCYQVDTATGQPTGPAINTTASITDGNGRFTLTTSANITGPLICTSTGGDDGVTLAPDLSVLIPESVTGDASVTANLTPLTTVATRIVQTQTVQNGGAASAQEITDTLTNVASMFGLTDFDLLKSQPDDASSDPQKVKYQQILNNLFDIADYLSSTNPNPPVTDAFAELIGALATDLANDDVLDGLDNGSQIPISTTYLDQVVPEFQYLLDTVIEMKFDPATSQLSNSVSMARNATKSSTGVLAIDVRANTINYSGVVGAAFEVDIQNTAVIQWSGSTTMTMLCTETPPSGCEPGDFLEQPPADNPVTYFVFLQQGTLSTLLAGAVQIPQTSGIPSGSDGTVITLKFRKYCDCSGSSKLEFYDNTTQHCADPNNPIGCNTLLDSNGNDITDVSWSGGTITTITFPPIISP
jgi:hypothetical protein